MRRDNARNWLVCTPNCPACEPHTTSTDSAIDAFQDFSRPTHFVTGRAALETLPTGHFDVGPPCASLRDGLWPTLLRESPSRARPRSGGSASGAPTELNPYARDLRFHQLLVSPKRYKCWSGHDHPCPRGDLNACPTGGMEGHRQAPAPAVSWRNTLADHLCRASESTQNHWRQHHPKHHQRPQPRAGRRMRAERCGGPGTAVSNRYLTRRIAVSRAHRVRWWCTTPAMRTGGAGTWRRSGGSPAIDRCARRWDETGDTLDAAR
jgi:hypothetical protein